MGTVPFEQVYDQIVTFAREAGTHRVVLFGSRVRGTNLPKSDIDIAIEGCPDFAALEESLQAERWSLLRLDVINLDAPPPFQRICAMRSHVTGGCSMKKYENYVSALNTLSTASEQDLENEFVQSGVIDKNTAHVYEVISAKQLVKAVIDQYIPEFVRLNIGLLGRYGDLLTATRR